MKTIQYVCERCGHTESRTILGRPLPEAEGEARDFCTVGVFAAMDIPTQDGLPGDGHGGKYVKAVGADAMWCSDCCAEVGLTSPAKATVDDEGLPPVPTVVDLLRTLARDEATEVVSEHESDTPHAV